MDAVAGALPRGLPGLLAGISLVTGLSGCSAGSTPASRPCPAALAGAKDLGTLAFLRAGKLVALDVAHCATRTLAPAPEIFGPVSWSADGRFVAFGPRVVSASGGRVERPFPDAEGTLAWAPRGHELAGVTRKGGLLVGGPGLSPRRLLADGWGAESVAWSPSGRLLAVSRSRFPLLRGRGSYHLEIWLVERRSGHRRELFRVPGRAFLGLRLAGFSPDGRWLLVWEEHGASLDSDGAPLLAVRLTGGRRAVRVTRSELLYGDFLSWCDGRNLAYVVNRGGRSVTLGDRIALAGPPDWKSTLTPGLLHDRNSYVSPACSPPGLFELAAAAGPRTGESPFGQERRRIWLLGYTGGNWHPLGPTPPLGRSDELPMWSAYGRWIAFVRSGPTNKDAGASGALYLLDLRRQSNGQARLVGPIASLGTTGNYYGHYGWSLQLAWRTGRSG
jgi:dipeptidyl aminopeptidase/acylaminoacyl peptidase